MGRWQAVGGRRGRGRARTLLAGQALVVVACRLASAGSWPVRGQDRSWGCPVPTGQAFLCPGRWGWPTPSAWGFPEMVGTPCSFPGPPGGLWEGRKRASRGQAAWARPCQGGWGGEGTPVVATPGSNPHLCPPRGAEAPERVGGVSPGSDVLRLAPARRPSPLLSSMLGSREPGLGLPPGQADKVQGAPGCGSGVGQPAGGFEGGEWQQGGSLAGPAVAGEGTPLAAGVKATGLWVDFGAFSGAGSSSSRGWSSGFRCGEGRAQPARPWLRA